jgi:ubiquinone/menaquinone biosynthesis C-methylase UbiE
MNKAPIETEVYQHGHHTSVVASHAKRTAEVEAEFVLPYLEPGMRLLDVGCGPGTITVGLAKRVHPGETIGIDPSASVIETARSLVDAKALGKPRFEVANIYEPPFAPESFDVVFAHQLLQHLRHPIDALRRMRSLLKPEGFVAVREVDWGSMFFYPENRGMQRFLEMYFAVAERHGSQQNAGRHMRCWFRAAGFTDCRLTTSTMTFADTEATRDWGETYAERTLHSSVGEKAVEYGIATREELERIASDWRAWGRHPDAFFCAVNTEVVAFRGSSSRKAAMASDLLRSDTVGTPPRHLGNATST